MLFLINDTLINRYKDNLNGYERVKVDNKNSKRLMAHYIPREKINAEIINLDNKKKLFIRIA